MSRHAASPLVLLAVAAGGGLLFAAALLYFAVSYLWRFEAAPAGSALLRPVLIDIALFSAFALHHSVFARAGLKAWVRRRVPPVLERSVYVWISSALFAAVCVWWQPVPGHLWQAEGVLRAMLLAGQVAAGVATLAAARRLDVFELAGVRQVVQGEAPARALDDTGPYSLVRHPIYLAWIALVWLAPAMTGTRLVFAAVSTGYLLAAIPFEERDLRRTFGDDYVAYSRKVRWRVLPYVF
jgi:hypothetical protein